MIVDFKDENIDLISSLYLKDLMGITHTPSLRILTIGEEILRNKFIGNLEAN